MCEEFLIKHLSAGALLRQEQAKGTSEGKLIDLFLKEGKIVPVSVSLALLKKSIEELKSSRYLIDGFPRNFDNLDGWNAEMKDLVDLESILFIDCNETAMEQRIMKRGENSGRDDDNLVSAKKRFQTFQRETMPVVERLQREYPAQFTRVSGDGTVDECYEEFRLPLLHNMENELIDKVGEYIDSRHKANGMKEDIHSRAVDAEVEFAGPFAEVSYKLLEEVRHAAIVVLCYFYDFIVVFRNSTTRDASSLRR